MSTYRFGKHPSKCDYRTLRFKNYLMPELAAPPASDSVLKRVYGNLKVSEPKALFPMDGNDQWEIARSRPSPTPRLPSEGS